MQSAVAKHTADLNIMILEHTGWSGRVSHLSLPKIRRLVNERMWWDLIGVYRDCISSRIARDACVWNTEYKNRVRSITDERKTLNVLIKYYVKEKVQPTVLT